MRDLVIVKDNVVVVSSKEIAIRFAKRHNDVVKSIENLTTKNSVVKDMFIETEFIHKGNTYKEYLMNRDGFSLLVMGFNGEKALEWKVKYIEAFNKMEEELRNTKPMLTREQELVLSIYNGGQEAVESVKELVDLKTKPLIDTIEEQTPKVEYHDEVLNSNKLISTTQIAKDLGMSARKLNELLHEKGVIFKQGKTWLLYSKYQHFIPELADYTINTYGQQLKWTEEGRKFIINLLK